MSFLNNSVFVFILLTFSVSVVIFFISVFDSSHYTENQVLSDIYFSSGIAMESKLMDLNDFQYLINNTGCSKNLFAVWLVTSHSYHSELRSAIRRAYPETILSAMGIHRVFLLAQTYEQKFGAPIKNPDFVSQNSILHENKRYSDILQGNFIESYKNLTYKHLMGLRWASLYCSDAKFIIKMDDDIVVDMYQIINLLNNLDMNDNTKNFMLGYILKGLKPIREPRSKWFVSKSEYKNSVYPPFLSGWFYVTSPTTASNLIELSTYSKYFWIDDLFITGELRKLTKIKLIDIHEKFGTDHRFVHCCLNDKKYSCDIFIGPNGGNNELIVEFQKHSHECVIKQCKTRPLTKSVLKSCILSVNKEHMGRGNAEINAIEVV